jgi:large subunit ribosomal protein L10
MSKPVKEMIIAEYKRRFEDVSDGVLVSIRGIPANDNNRLRLGLAQQEIRVSVLNNTLAAKAFEGSGLGSLNEQLQGPSALVYGGESVVEVAREITRWAKEIQLLELKGAVLDGVPFMGAKGVEQLSKFPTRDEAIAQDIALIMSPGRNLLGQVTGPGGRLMSIIKQIEEKLEKGEEITKTA